ncbi:MAG: SelB domain-containing protein, partial [bacterium]
AGQRTALNLSGIDKEILERGVVLGSAGRLKLSRRFDVSLQLLKDAPSIIRNRDHIRFHHGSGEILGRVYLLESTSLEPGERSLAQIRLDHSTVCFPGDHFILRRYSPLLTIGGGIVLDGDPPKWRQKNREDRCNRMQEVISALANSEEAGFAILIEHYVERSGVLGIDLNTLASLTGLASAKVEGILNGLETIRAIPLEPPLFANKANLELLKQKICSYLQRYHRSKPLSFGSSREELKERFLPGGTSPYFQFLLNTWQEENSIKVLGSNVALHGSDVRLTAEQEESRRSILQIIEHSKLNTPTLDELTERLGRKGADVRDLLFYLLESGDILKISGNMVLLPSQLRWVEDRVRTRFPTGTTFTVSDFKDLLSISRKYAIPLLELLDRNKVTRRTGDSRMVI